MNFISTKKWQQLNLDLQNCNEELKRARSGVQDDFKRFGDAL